MPRSRSPAFVAIRALISSASAFTLSVRAFASPLRAEPATHELLVFGASVDERTGDRLGNTRRSHSRARAPDPGGGGSPVSTCFTQNAFAAARIRSEELRVPFDAVEAQPQRPIEAERRRRSRDRSRKCGSPTFVRAHEHVTERVGRLELARRTEASGLPPGSRSDPKLRHGLQQNARGNLVGPLAPPPDANDRALHLEEPTPGRRSHAARSRSRGCSKVPLGDLQRFGDLQRLRGLEELVGRPLRDRRLRAGSRDRGSPPPGLTSSSSFSRRLPRRRSPARRRNRAACRRRAPTASRSRGASELRKRR